MYLPPLAKRVDKEIAQKIVDATLAGIIVSPEYNRYYPESSLASQVLGFVDFENKGRYGVEGYYDQELRGFGGTITAEKDNKGRFISLVGKQLNVIESAKRCSAVN